MPILQVMGNNLLFMKMRESLMTMVMNGNLILTKVKFCLAEHKYLNKLAGKGIYIVGMNYKDERKKAIRWLTDLKDPYKISLYDKDGMLGMDLGVYGAPETFFIDSKGIIQYRHVGNITPGIWNDYLSDIYEKME
jgi:cytochrome c biogenesis protein CcmG/thiol:disulfide interchange protein DsbE